jgi:hypothetical protein
MSLIKREVITLGTEYALGSTLKYAENYSRQEMYSGRDGHYGYPDYPSNRNVGGMLNLYGANHVHVPSTPDLCWRGGANDQHYVGSFVTDIEADSFLGLNRDGAAWGPEAYSKMKPAQPEIDLLNSMYEMREIPQVLKQRFHFNNLHELGSFHLATQFGWLALLRDTRNFVQTQRTVQNRLKQLLRDNGKPVRRRKTLVETMTAPTTTTGTFYGCLKPILVTQYYSKEPNYRHVRYDTDKVWASARFRYYLPKGPRDVAWKKNMLYKLYGMQFPSPRMIYNAIPWSWLIDYFTNLGDVISNLDGGVADRLAADYFYVMREFRVHEERTSTGGFYRPDGSKFTVVASTVREYSQKTRLRGDPFGFNTNENSLSGMQLSILGALGLSRLR